MNEIYLDYAAATPMDPRVISAMQPYFEEHFHNPSALYKPARDAQTTILLARTRIAGLLGAKPNEIIFTSGGTESNNLAIRGIMDSYPMARLLVSSIEHESVLEPASQYNSSLLAVKNDGLIDLTDLEAQIDDEVVLVSIMHANNEIGVVQPLHKIAQLLKKIRLDRQQRKVKLPLYLHSDAAQSSNYQDLHVHRLGVDLLTINGGKMYGPKQAGVLFVAASTTLRPQILGGGQQRGLRSGSESTAMAVGLATALEISQAIQTEESSRLLKLQLRMIGQLTAKIPNIVLNGSMNQRLPNNIHFTVPGCDNERLLMQLDAKDIYAAAGSACSASKDVPSHVLRAIGLSDQEAQSSLRFSLGRSTTENQLDHVVTTLAGLLA